MIEVAPGRPDQVDVAIAVATRAFWDDPMFNYFQPDLLRQHRTLPGFFGAALHDCAAHGELWVATIDGSVAGVAAWLPPGVPQATTGRRALQQTRRILPTMIRSPKRRAGQAMTSEMAKRHPHEDHWYLQVLATDPMFQGRGVGRALLEPVLARADETGHPVYLETQKESNLPYYQRFAFEVTDEFTVLDSPRLWCMLRTPR